MTSKFVGLRLLACGLCVIVAACSDPAVRKARHLEQGKAYMAEGKTADAIIEFRNALKIDARYGDARYELARAFDQTGNPAAAREYVRAGDLLPDRPDVQVKAASLLLAAGEFEQARKHADLALKTDPSLIDAQIVRAYTLAGLKDVDGAIKELEKASAAAPGDFRPYVSLGAVEAASGKLTEAEAAFKKAVLADPSSAQAKLGLAYFYWATRRPAEAERVVNEVLAADPNDVGGNRLLALVYGATGRVREAEGPLRRLVGMKDARATLALADVYMNSGRTDEARPLYEQLRSEKATRDVAAARLAGLEFRAGRRAEAHAVLDAQLKETPNSVPLLSLKAQVLSADGNRDAALQTARKAVGISPESAEAQYALGFAEAELRNHDAAATAYAEALRRNPGMTAAQVELSRLMLLAGKTDEALSLALAARKADPANVQARMNLTRALLQKGDIRAAEEDARALVQALPKAAPAHALYGRVLLARGDGAGAVAAFDRALALNPAEVDAVAGRTAVDLARKRPQEARARIERAVATAPSSSALLLAAAQFERADGRIPAAEQYLRKAIDLEPTNLAAYNQLAALYLSQNRLEEGRRELEEVVRRKPDASVAPRTMIAIIDQIQGRTDDARKRYEEIIRDSSTAGVAANNLAYMYADRGEQLDRALELAQRAKSQMPDNADVSDTLGWAYYKRGMPDMAVKAFEFSVGKDPKNPIYLVHLGLAYAKAGQPQKARTALTQALQLKADVEGAAEARAVLASLQS